MDIRDFKLERFFARYEFTTKYLLSASDCESLRMADLLKIAPDGAKKMWENLSLGYPENQGHPLLRQEISKLYRKIEPENILIVVPEEGIFITMNSILQQGDHIIVTSPAYQSLYEICHALKCKVSHWRLNPNNQWELDLDFLKRNITKKTKLIVVNFPHNPTGYLPSKKQFMDIVNIANDHNLFLFSDEMYWLLEHSSERLPSACEVYEKAVTLFGLSKTFSLPGLRIGWLVTRNSSLAQKFTSFKDYTTICSSAPSEILAVMALKLRKKIITNNLKIIKNNIKIADEFFSKHINLFSWIKPSAGSVAFPKLKSKMSIEEFCYDIIKKKSLTILPGTIFEFPGNHFRIGLGRKNLPECLKILEEYLLESKTKLSSHP